MDSIQPWAMGPLELLCEAQLSVERGDDVGRRIALILFDDAVEVYISTYLELHPMQRAGKSYQKEQVARWLGNFHTRLDFLDEELLSRSLTWEVERGTIIWTHDYRNDQYHGGRKGTPEQHVLTHARKAALWIFSFLLDVPDPEDTLASALAARAAPPPMTRDPRYDRAIDSEHGMVEIDGQPYHTSEILFNLDYTAYTDVGARLSARAALDESEAEG